MRVLIGYPNLPMMITPALAVGLFTRILDDLGVEVDLFETTPYSDSADDGMLFKSKLGGGRIYTPEDIGLELRPRSQMRADWQRRVEEFHPDLILISTVEDTLDDTLTMLESIQHHNIPHLIGGVLPINDPEFVLGHDLIDTICRYEGELVLKDAIHAWKAGKDWRQTPGIWYKKTGQIIRNQLQPLCDINDVVPDYRLYDPNRFNRPIGGNIVRAVQMETYRGCPYSCTFCNSPMTRSMDKNFLRRKDMYSLRRELDSHLKNLDVNYWFIGDDSFLARPRQEIFEICRVFEEYQVPWWCNTRLENIDSEVLAAMRAGYCDRIQFGIESGNEKYRREVLLRPVSNEVYLQKAQELNASGIPYGLNAIIGMPGETRDMVFETVDLIRDIGGYDGLGVSIFIPYRGTQLRKYAVEKGFLDPNYRSQAGYLKGGSALNMPESYLQPDEIWDLALLFKHYCFFDRSRWDEITVENLEKLDAIYNREFYTERAADGETHIRLRNSNPYACSANSTVDFRQ